MNETDFLRQHSLNRRSWARFDRMAGRIAGWAAMFCLLLAVTAHGAAWTGPSTAEQQLFDLLNKERQRAGLAKLDWNQKLADAARRHSALLAQHKDLSHQFGGEPPLERRAGAAGAHFNSVAENVAFAPAVEAMHCGLMHSPHHRANILNGEYNAVGISIVARGGELYATQDFASVIPGYTEAQFQEAVVAASTRARQARGLRPMTVRSDPRLKRAACAKTLDAAKVLSNLPGAADLVIYTASDPDKLPSNMQRAVTDRTLRRMNIGVCFQSGNKSGFSRYWVAAAFYPVE